MQFHQLLQSALLAGVTIAMPNPGERPAGVVTSVATPPSTVHDQQFSPLEKKEALWPFHKPAAGEERKRLGCDKKSSTLMVGPEASEECLGTVKYCEDLVEQWEFEALQECLATREPAPLPFLKPAAGEYRKRLGCDEKRVTLNLGPEASEECLGTMKYCEDLVEQWEFESLKECLATREPAA